MVDGRQEGTMARRDVMRLLGVLVLVLAGAGTASARDLTFIATSDTHYRQPDHRLGHHNDLNRATVDEINRIADEAWPANPGGGPIGRPRGIVVPGDLIDDGDMTTPDKRVIAREQFGLFLADFGLDGTDGRIRYPVFEGWGNHDGPPEGKEKFGFSLQGELKKRNAVRLQRGLIDSVSSNGLHYAWTWDDVRFVMLNLYPADRQREGLRYSPVWHDPQGSLSFLKADLAARVGTSGRPVVLISHCGFDTDWWTKDDWRDLYEAMRPYNIVLYIYGHSGTGVLAWAPEGESVRWDCINDGQTEKGFFVIRITDDRVRAVMRTKKGLTSAKQPDGSFRKDWTGEWEWKWPMDRKLRGAPNPPGARL
jgi:hypothetical protein